MISLLRITRRPDVTFCQDGRIDITARIARMLSMEDGDVIDVGLEKGEYFIYVKLKASNAIGKHEACVHRTNKGKLRSNNYRAYSKTLAQAIRCASKCEEGSARLAAGDCVEIDGIGKAVPLITRRLL